MDIDPLVSTCTAPSVLIGLEGDHQNNYLSTIYLLIGLFWFLIPLCLSPLMWIAALCYCLLWVAALHCDLFSTTRWPKQTGLCRRVLVSEGRGSWVRNIYFIRLLLLGLLSPACLCPVGITRTDSVLSICRYYSTETERQNSEFHDSLIRNITQL